MKCFEGEDDVCWKSLVDPNNHLQEAGPMVHPIDHMQKAGPSG